MRPGTTIVRHPGHSCHCALCVCDVLKRAKYGSVLVIYMSQCLLPFAINAVKLRALLCIPLHPSSLFPVMRINMAINEINTLRCFAVFAICFACCSHVTHEYLNVIDFDL